jgi:hypothetical protein
VKEIIVTDHALSRFQERGNPGKSKEDIEKIFRTQPLVLLESAWRGREIASVGGYVWVIRRTAGKTALTTCLGHANDYTLKRPHKKGDLAEVSYAKWLQHQNYKSKRKSGM